MPSTNPFYASLGIAGEIDRVDFDERKRIESIDFSSGTTSWRIKIDYPEAELYEYLSGGAGAVYRAPGKPRIEIGRIVLCPYRNEVTRSRAGESSGGQLGVVKNPSRDDTVSTLLSRRGSSMPGKR